MYEADFFDNFYVINQGRVGIIKGDIFDDGSSFYVDYSDKNNWEVMQYTGLQDKNGKEIYEGDIVAVKKFKWIIAMGCSTDGEYGWLQKRIGDDVGKSYIITENDGIDERYEVIGNIYENPELLH